MFITILISAQAAFKDSSITPSFVILVLLVKDSAWYFSIWTRYINIVVKCNVIDWNWLTCDSGTSLRSFERNKSEAGNWQQSLQTNCRRRRPFRAATEYDC